MHGRAHLTHDDGSLNGQLQVLQSGAHETEHTLHAVHLLAQEDVHTGKNTHLLQPSLHLYIYGHGTSHCAAADGSIAYLYHTDFVRNVVIRQLVQHVGSEAEHSVLPSLPTTSTAALGLDAHDGVQNLLGHITLVPAHMHSSPCHISATAAQPCGDSRDVGIGVQPKHLWGVHQREVVNELAAQVKALALRDAVALVEGKCLREHVVPEPHLARPEETLRS